MTGILMAYRLNPRWDITAESMGQYSFGNRLMPAYHKELTGQLEAGLSIGTRYHLAPGLAEKIFTEKKDWQKGIFFETAYGMTFPIAIDASTFRNIGSSWNLRFGTWFSSLFGVRAGLQLQHGYWNVVETENYVRHYAKTTATGQVELLTDLLQLSPRWRERNEESKWGLNLALGLEAGANRKGEAANHPYRSNFAGFVGSLQALYRVAPGAYLFLEPRYEMQPNNNHSETNVFVNPKDRNIDLYFGARIVRPNKEGRQQLKDDADEDPFQRNLWLGLDLGGLKAFHCNKFTTGDGVGVRPAVSVNVGYDLHPLSTMRLQAQFNSFKFNQHNPGSAYIIEGKYKKIDVRLIHMLNMTNLWRGTRNTPKFSVFWEVGPTLGTMVSQKPSRDNKTAFGLMTGILMAYRINPQWDITAESTGQYKFDANFLPAYHKHRTGQIEAGLSVGTRFHF